MKNGVKLLAAGAALLTAALGVAAYRKYRDSYEQIPEDAELETEAFEEVDFEPVTAEEDYFDYYVASEDMDQIMFYE